MHPERGAGPEGIGPSCIMAHRSSSRYLSAMTGTTPERRRWKRRLIIIGSVLAVVLTIVAFLLPYILKRYIEANSEAWIGRKVTIDWLILNPFTLKYGVYGFTCHEPKSTDVFVSWDEVSVRTDLWDGFQKKHWRFNTVRITDPYFHVVQRGDRFNFTDLMELGGTDTVPSTDTSTVLFTMEDILLSGGRIDYASDLLRAPVQVVGLEARCTQITSEEARMDFALGFDLASGGRLDGGFMIDPSVSAYGVDAKLKGFQLPQLLPYLQDFFACKGLNGTMDLRLNVLDNYADTTSLLLSAGLDLDKVELTDPGGKTLFALKHANAALDTMVAATGHLEVGRVLVDGADVHFTMLADGTDNWTRHLKLDSAAVGKEGAQLQASESNVFVMLAEYVSYLGQQMIASEYTADSLALVNTAVHFEDHTPALPFRYAITGINVASQRVTSEQAEGIIRAGATLNGTGRLQADAVFDPGDLRNVVVDLNVDELDLAHLDPYVRWYAAHPMEDGLLRFSTTTSIFEGQLDSKNHLRVDKLKVGRKVDEHDPEATVLPLRLAAGLLKDVNGVVELDVPVKGDLNDPQFKVWPIVWQVLKNLIVKAATAPARLLVRAVKGSDEADLERVRFAHLQHTPAKDQLKTLRQLASALKAKPELSVDLVPIVDERAELQEVAVFKVKQAFLFGDKGTLAAADSARIAELGTRDSLFTAFVEQRTPAMDGRPLHERAVSMAGADACRTIARELEEARKEHVMQYLLDQGVPAARMKFRAGTQQDLAGQQGVPGYRFVYDMGEEP